MECIQLGLLEVSRVTFIIVVCWCTSRTNTFTRSGVFLVFGLSKAHTVNLCRFSGSFAGKERSGLFNSC